MSVEKNIMIAKFMGYEIKGHDFIYPKEMYDLYKPLYMYEFESGKYLFEDDVTDIKFHINWSWLMPVVKKILYQSYTMDGVVKMKAVQDALITCSIEKTYDRVCEFIEWYNSY